MATLSKIWEYIKLHFKWFLFILASIIFIALFLWLSSKNRKIKSLETSLAIIQAKLQLNGLAIKYDANVEKLKELRTTETGLNDKLVTIENSLKGKLKDSMTEEEIANKFKEIKL